MDKMNLKSILKEEFADYVKPPFGSGKEYPVFVNPSPKEIMEAMGADARKKVRIIADSLTKKLYVFSPNLLHEFVAKKIGIKYYNNNFAFFGVGIVDKGKVKINVSSSWTMRDNSNLDNFFSEDIDKKWGWADRYSNLLDFLKKEQEMIEKNGNKRDNEIDMDEEFVDYMKNFFGNEMPVFINPSKSEMVSLRKNRNVGIRFIIDNSSKKFYAFDESLFHEKVARKFNIPYSEESTSVFFGEGELPNITRIKITDSYMFHDAINKKELLGKDIDKKWGWADQYANVTEFLTLLKKRGRA